MSNNDDITKKQKELIEKLSEIVAELEWVIGLPVGSDSVPGLIIGTEEFVRDVVETYYGPNYDVFTEDPTGTNTLTEVNEDETKTKKKPTFH